MLAEYLAIVGYNLTDDIFQADEVLAQIFALLIENHVPSQGLLDRMEALFNQKGQ